MANQLPRSLKGIMHSPGLLIPNLMLLAMASSSPLGVQAPAAPQVGDLCTGGEATGTGLRGAYYSANPATSRPVLVRLDAQVNAGTVRRLPASLLAKPPHTVRWCGWIRPIMSGPHRLGSAHPGLRIEIGNKPVAGKAINLEAGQSYSILVELPDAAGAREFSLQWTPPFGATYDVPPTVLFPPVQTVDPGC
jgi:hypothetical protein